jgi:hypothetical protein
MISKAKTELWHRLLTHYLPLYFPEIARFADNLHGDWLLAFLEQFPTPFNITTVSRTPSSMPPDRRRLESRQSAAARRHV